MARKFVNTNFGESQCQPGGSEDSVDEVHGGPTQRVPSSKERANFKSVQDRVTALSHDLHEMLSQLIVRAEERITALSQDLHEILCQLVVRTEETVATLSQDLHEMFGQLIARAQDRVKAFSQDLHEMLGQLIADVQVTADCRGATHGLAVGFTTDCIDSIHAICGLDSNTWNITDSVTTSTEICNQNFIALINEIQSTVARHKWNEQNCVHDI